MSEFANTSNKLDKILFGNKQKQAKVNNYSEINN